MVPLTVDWILPHQLTRRQCSIDTPTGQSQLGVSSWWPRLTILSHWLPWNPIPTSNYKVYFPMIFSRYFSDTMQCYYIFCVLHPTNITLVTQAASILPLHHSVSTVLFVWEPAKGGTVQQLQTPNRAPRNNLNFLGKKTQQLGHWPQSRCHSDFFKCIFNVF